MKKIKLFLIKVLFQFNKYLFSANSKNQNKQLLKII